MASEPAPANADPILSANIRRLMKARGLGGIGALRKAMAEAGYSIGNSTLHRALKGEEGNRVESLSKIAQFFDVTTAELLQADLGLEEGEQPAKEPNYIVDDEDAELLDNLSMLAPSRRSAFIDAVKQEAEMIREAIRHQEARKHKAPAAARRVGPARATATIGAEGDSSRQLPLRTVADPFNAEPNDSELRLYKHFGYPDDKTK